MTDAEQGLARAASGGDRAALEELIRRLYKPVCALAARLLPRLDQADDVAQETFARVATHISKFDSSRPFSAWVFAIAANLCRDRHRRDKSTRFLESVDAQDVTIDAPPENSAIRRENRDRVLREVGKLPRLAKAGKVREVWIDRGEMVVHLVAPVQIKGKPHRQVNVKPPDGFFEADDALKKLAEGVRPGRFHAAKRYKPGF